MGQIVELASMYKNIKREDIKMATVPTYPDDTSGISYQVIDQTLLAEYINEYLLGLPPPITVEIINCNDMGDYSYELEENLNSMGFKVVNVKNDVAVYDRSQIIINSSGINEENLTQVINILGKPEIINEATEDAWTDITIIIGTDYSNY